MLIIKNEKSKTGHNYLALILLKDNKYKIYLSFDRDLICRILNISIYTFYELLKDDNYCETILN